MADTSSRESLKKCIRCQYVLYDNLNIVYDAETEMVVLWNKFQIFLFENRRMENYTITLNSEKRIHQLLLSNNYILCLDEELNIMSLFLQFHTDQPKRLRTTFQHQVLFIIAWFRVEDYLLSIKYESERLYLCQNKINSDLCLEKKVMLQYTSHFPLPKPTQDKCILTSYKISDQEFEHISQIYNKITMVPESSLVFMCFDKLTIFTCLFSPHTEEDQVTLIRLHTCPLEISGMEVTDKLILLACLTSGSILKFDLKGTVKKPQVVHLNTAIEKYIVMNNHLVYTDGLTMWKAENFLSNDSDKAILSQYIYMHVKDMARCGDQIICTTYSKLIYVMSLDDSRCFKPSATEYCEAQSVLSNTEYLFKVLEEAELNNSMTKKFKQEKDYISILALSTRHDLMDTIIDHAVTVYDNYEDALKDNLNLILIEKRSEYFSKDPILFVIKITTNMMQEALNNIVANPSNDLQLHISFFSDFRLLKTATLKLKSLKKLNILTCLKEDDSNIAEVTIVLRIMSCMPGSLDHKQPMWTCLYHREVHITSEHFIKITESSIQYATKDPEDTLDNLILKAASNSYNQLFNFVDANPRNPFNQQWTFYVKLPSNYKTLLVSDKTIDKDLHPKKANFLKKMYSDKDFFEHWKPFVLHIGKDNVKVNIFDDTDPALEVTSKNVMKAFHMRNFFAKLFYEGANNDNAYIDHSVYMMAESLRKDIEKCIDEKQSMYEFKGPADSFERNVIGALPM